MATWSGSPLTPRETRAYAWHGRLDGPASDASGIALGSPCRTASNITPLLLPDGRVAVAWADDGVSRRGDFMTSGEGDGAIHVALPTERSATPPPPKPRPRVRLLGGDRVGPRTPLRLRVDCGGAGCDVLASASTVAFAGRSRDTTLVAATAPGAGARETAVTLRPDPTMAFAEHGEPRRVPVTVTACTRDGGAATTTVRVEGTLRGRPLPPQPRIAELSARRIGGGRVRVSWRQTRPTGRDGSVTVMLLDRRGRGIGYTDRAVRDGERYRAVVGPQRDLGLGAGRAVRVRLFLSTAEQFDAAHASAPVR